MGSQLQPRCVTQGNQAVVRGEHVGRRMQLRTAVTKDVRGGHCKVLLELLRDDLSMTVPPIRLCAHVRSCPALPIMGCDDQLLQSCLALGLSQKVRDAIHLVPQLRTVPVGDLPPCAEILQASLLELREAAAGWDASDINKRSYVVLGKESQELVGIVIGMADSVDERFLLSIIYWCWDAICRSRHRLGPGVGPN